MKDRLGNEAKIGDLVAVITKDCGEMNFGFGLVASITKTGNIKIEYIFPNYSVKYIRDSRFLIVNEKKNSILKEKLKR